MRVEDINAEVSAIASMTGDNESAHCREDGLYIDVLRAIAGGARNAKGLAAAAPKAKELDYERWYA